MKDVLKIEQIKNVLNEQDRLVKGWGSVEIVDKDGEVIPMEELDKAMPKIIERGAPIIDHHSNKIIGKILNYEFKKHPKTNKEGLLLTYKIFKDYSLDDEAWSEIKSGERGLSFGGRAHKRESNIRWKDLNGPADVLRSIEGHEFSSVRDPANPEATNVEANLIAKGDIEKPERRHHSAKWHRCVDQLRREGEVDSPEGVCTASLGEESYKGLNKFNYFSEKELKKINNISEHFKKSVSLKTDRGKLLNRETGENMKKEDVKKPDTFEEQVIELLQNLNAKIENMMSTKQEDEEEKPEEEEDKPMEDEDYKTKQGLDPVEQKEDTEVTLPKNPAETAIEDEPAPEQGETDQEKLVEKLKKEMAPAIVAEIKKSLNIASTPRPQTKAIKKSAPKPLNPAADILKRFHEGKITDPGKFNKEVNAILEKQHADYKRHILMEAS